MAALHAKRATVITLPDRKGNASTTVAVSHVSLPLFALTWKARETIKWRDLTRKIKKKTRLLFMNPVLNRFW